MSPSVLLVDDESDIITSTFSALRRAGFTVHSFTDPIEAINHIREEGCKDCRLLLSDIRMPKMNGFQLVRTLKELRPEMKVIMMTAFEVDKKEFEIVFPSLPVDTIVKKPFRPSIVVEMIKEIYYSSEGKKIRKQNLI